MSTQTRNSGGGGFRNQKKSASGGGGSSGTNDGTTQATSKKTDMSKTEKEKVHPKPTAEQLRIAQITNSNATEDPQMREKVATLIEMTQRSEEEVCCALYECDNNLERAVVFLFETLPVGAFETSSKKKKNKVANTGQDTGATGDGEWVDTGAKSERREKSRNRSSNRGGRGGTDSRGWRGRETRENDKNIRESRGDRGDRGDRGGDERRREYRGDRWNNERRGGGRTGGRTGGRGTGGRGERGGGSNYGARQNANEDYHEVALWDNTIAQNAEKQQQTQDDAWGDWDNEEYVGSLKDSKVFTTSNLPNQTVASVVSGNVDVTAPPGLEHHLGTSVLGNSPPQQGSHLNALVGSGVNTGSGLAEDITAASSVQPVVPATTAMQYSAAVSNPPVVPQAAVSAAASVSLNATPYTAADTFSNAATAAANLVQQVTQQHPQQLKGSATLSAEQSQYFNSLSSQNTGTVQPQPMGGTYTQTPPAQYSAAYPNVFGTAATGNAAGNVAGDQTQLSNSQQPQVRRARAKLPPPSKIPSTAVEMPSDSVNNVGFLDVQFGGLDFGTDDSFDSLSDKFNTSVTMDVQQQADAANEYQNKSNVQQQSTLTASLQNAQITDTLTNNYAQRAPNTVPQTQQVGTGGSVGSGGTGLETLAKNDPYNQSNASGNANYQGSYQSTATANKSGNVYQQGNAGQGFNSSNYANVQSPVSSSYQAQSYSSYQSNAVNSYQQQQQQPSGGGAQSATNAVAGGNVNNGSNTAQNIPVGGNGNGNSNANASTGYLSSSYQSPQTAYQSNHSVYVGTGLNNSSGVSSSNAVSNSGTAVSSTSTNAGSTTNANNNTSSVNSTIAVANNSSTTNSNSNNASSVVAAAAAVSSTSNKNSATGIAPNIQMVSQYIQTGLPYYQQPVYTYEDIQMMQQRVPHVGYYDLNYTPTSLGAGRDNLGSVAYSMTDGRFARADNNSSPVGNVSSSMSQQAGSGGPMLNVPYAYFYGGNVMPGSFQYGTPAIYPQIPAANTASGGQFPKPSYNTGYGSTNYDALSQTSQDYSKGSYPSSVSQQTKSQNVANPPQAGGNSEIASSMYGKGHVALNKVNSYEKQNFHSGTPPPFNISGTQAAGGTSAQPYGMYLPMPATGHHNMIHQPIHQMDGRIHNSSRRDSNSTGQRQQTNNQSKSSAKQGYSPSYWTGQN